MNDASASWPDDRLVQLVEIERSVESRYAALLADPDLPGSTYAGPNGPLQMSGFPRIASPLRLAHDRNAQIRPWDISEEFTSARFLDQ